METVVSGVLEILNLLKLKTYIQEGMTPPGGTTHGSAEPYVAGVILPLETLWMIQGTEFITM